MYPERLNSVVKPSPRAMRSESAALVHTATSPDIRRGKSRSRALGLRCRSSDGSESVRCLQSRTLQSIIVQNLYRNGLLSVQSMAFV